MREKTHEGIIRVMTDLEERDRRNSGKIPASFLPRTSFVPFIVVIFAGMDHSSRNVRNESKKKT